MRILAIVLIIVGAIALAVPSWVYLLILAIDRRVG